MQSMYPKVDSSTFSDFKDFLFDLFFCLFYYLFYSRRMDPAIGDKLVKSKACNFPSYRIESRKYYCFRGIIHDYLYTCCSFKGSYIPSLTSDDPAFHFIRINVKDCNCIFDGVFGSNSLDSLDDYSFGFLVCGHLCFIEYLVDV